MNSTNSAEAAGNFQRASLGFLQVSAGSQESPENTSEARKAAAKRWPVTVLRHIAIHHLREKERIEEGTAGQTS
ncbi:MAG: hypothetical protein NXI04_01045 [Planctomycetaceae bacterium]|nr:hypothetical protein [Planctomycetaceae bacterium]